MQLKKNEKGEEESSLARLILNFTPTGLEEFIYRLQNLKQDEQLVLKGSRYLNDELESIGRGDVVIRITPNN